MNLGIEYLLRTGAIRNFLELPCCLFVENTDNRKVVSLQELSDRPDFYSIDIWDLEKLFLLSDRPIHTDVEHFEIPKDDVFNNKHTILDGYFPLRYVEQPVASSRNTYKCPMSVVEYNHFIDNYLNSSKHRITKSDWLWQAFVKKSFGYLTIDDYFSLIYWERRSAIDREQRIVQGDYKYRWSQWLLWKKTFLKHEVAAPELIFATAYESKYAASSS